MNYKILILLFGMFFLISLINALEVTLIAPENETIVLPGNSIWFNATVTSDVNLINISLFTDYGGIWSLNKSSNLSLVTENFSIDHTIYDVISTATGIRITAIGDNYLRAATKNSNCNASRLLVYFENGTLIDTANFVGDVATLSSPIQLIDGDGYRIIADDNGAAYNRTLGNNTAGLLPRTYNNFIITHSSTDASNISTTNVYNLVALTIGLSSSLLSYSGNYSNIITGTTLWNFQVCDNSSACTFAANNRTVIALYENYNTSTYETSSESFILNANYTGFSSFTTSANLIYGGVSYAGTKDGDTFTKTFDIPLGEATKSFYWNISLVNATGTYYKSTPNQTQTISSFTFAKCNETYTVPFLNLTFKDESDLSYINATIPLSTFTYWLGSGIVNKTLSYTNTTLNYNYTFCGTDAGKNLNVDVETQYASTNYPQRIWQPSTQLYNSTITNQLLYLLGSNDGIYVTYQVINSGDSPIANVNVDVTRLISGETVTIGTGQTDAAGLVTFWVNPDFLHTLTFEKSGYDTYILNHFPTQTSYTVTLASGESSEQDLMKGISYSILPTAGDFINPNTNTTFNFTLSSSFWDLDSFGFTLTNDLGAAIGGNTSSLSNGGFVTNIINVSNYSSVTMNYYWIINGTSSNLQVTWIVYNETVGNSWSLWVLFTDAKTYVGDGFFGINNDAFSLIIFILIFSSVGIMSYKFGISSPAAISGMVFALVFFFDVALDLDSYINPVEAVQYFPTIFIGIIMAGLIIKETTR